MGKKYLQKILLDCIKTQRDCCIGCARNFFTNRLKPFNHALKLTINSVGLHVLLPVFWLALLYQCHLYL